MEQIPLAEALICINCNTLFRLPGKYCPHCAGEQVVPLSKWLSPRPAAPVWRCRPTDWQSDVSSGDAQTLEGEYVQLDGAGLARAFSGLFGE